MSALPTRPAAWRRVVFFVFTAFAALIALAGPKDSWGNALLTVGLAALFAALAVILSRWPVRFRSGGRAALAVVCSLGLVVAGSMVAAPSERPGEPEASASAVPTPTSEPTATPTATPAPAPPAPNPSPSLTAPALPLTGEPALALLATLEVKGRAPQTGYDRVGGFGPAWEDVDGNGCDQRNDVLARDLLDINRPSRCRVLSGILVDAYTGEVHDFVRGQDTSPLVQIDHVVALADAWQKGAQQLTYDQRVRFANDPINLRAVAGAINQEKGAGDAATWLPPQRSIRCAYAATQIAVKAHYRLWVTAAEKSAFEGILSACPDERTPVSTLPAVPAPPAEPAEPAVPPADDAPAAPPAENPDAGNPGSETVSGIHPGGYCADYAVGTRGVADNGRTYICGGKGADSSGRYRWNRAD